MKNNSIYRITLSIVFLCTAAIFTAGVTGIIPDERVVKETQRSEQCESIASSVAFLISKHEFRQAARQIELLQSRQSDLDSVGLRFQDGTLVAQAGGHGVFWTEECSNEADGCYAIAITTGNQRWGTLELRYQPIYVGYRKYISSSLASLLSLLLPLVGCLSFLQLSRSLKFLDPTQVVPSRVRQTLDNFAEGVVLLDEEDRIILSNRVFASYLDKGVDELIGTRLWSLPWDFTSYDGSPIVALRAPTNDGTVVRGTTMRLADEDGNIKAVFSVNASPVLDESGKYQGLMAAFADITPLEQSRENLCSTLSELKITKKEITKQNEELRYLATRDPLTGCINRRTFFEDFEKLWGEARNGGAPLCAMMVDIDFFKPINDNYGHSMGDEVLRQTGALLNSMTRKEDIVCRYGGEEFSILMPGLSLEQAEAAAESIRIRMSELEFPEFKITASLGVSGHILGADDPQGMLDQADKCLYVAKRNGRNQVVRFDTVPEDLIVDESKISREKPKEDTCDPAPKIPFSAVTALHSALSYRDSQTGGHCVRVSNYAALMAQRLLGPSEVYVVEIAALLHDIGKVGVPDAVLLKPGKLTPDEWRLMGKHDLVGVEIINKSFKHEELTDIVRYHHFHFGGERGDQQERQGQDIPVGSRILTIADAFDSMVSDKPYRKRLPIEAAFQELRDCSGTQFDPELVELFIDVVHSGQRSTSSGDALQLENDVVLNIGEQVERLADAADAGDNEMFLALAERLRQTATQHNVQSIQDAATQAIEAVSEDSQLSTLVNETFELLAACRNVRGEIRTDAILEADQLCST